MWHWLIAHYEVLKDFAGPAVSLVGFIITIVIAVIGFNTFDRWKREKIEEKRIDIALESLSVAHETKLLFGRVRDPDGFEGEWRGMAVKEGESEEERAMRGGSYAILMRLNASGEYFERVARLQPKAIAVFGGGVEKAFERLNEAQKLVREAAVQLTWRIPVHPVKPSEEDFQMRMRLRGDLWAGFGGHENRVEHELAKFRSEMEAIFRPVIEREFRRH